MGYLTCCNAFNLTSSFILNEFRAHRAHVNTNTREPLDTSTSRGHVIGDPHRRDVPSFQDVSGQSGTTSTFNAPPRPSNSSSSLSSPSAANALPMFRLPAALVSNWSSGDWSASKALLIWPFPKLLDPADWLLSCRGLLPRGVVQIAPSMDSKQSSGDGSGDGSCSALLTASSLAPWLLLVVSTSFVRGGGGNSGRDLTVPSFCPLMTGGGNVGKDGGFEKSLEIAAARGPSFFECCTGFEGAELPLPTFWRFSGSSTPTAAR